jgi:hypothetical protein
MSMSETEIIKRYKLTDGGMNGIKKCGDKTLLDGEQVWKDEVFQHTLDLIPYLYYCSDSTRVGLSSYKVKHEVEDILYRYISHGKLILAFLYLDFEVSNRNAPNGCIKVQRYDMSADNPSNLLRFVKKYHKYYTDVVLPKNSQTESS